MSAEALTCRRYGGKAWRNAINFMPENDHDPMPQAWRDAFHKALLRTDDWIRHSGLEPEVYLDGTPMAAQTLFHLMTKFDQDRMRDVEIQLTHEILGGLRVAHGTFSPPAPSYGKAAKYRYYGANATSSLAGVPIWKMRSPGPRELRGMRTRVYRPRLGS
jgi:hypothetical protein